MPVTFHEARLLCLTTLRPEWPDHLGTFHVSVHGLESATHYRMFIGAREWYVGQDRGYILMDPPTILVAKETGLVTRHPWYENIPTLGWREITDSEEDYQSPST